MKFEGQNVIAINCTMQGSVGDSRLNTALSPGDKLVVVAECYVAGVGHQLKEKGLVRVQALKVSDGFALRDETDADDLIHRLRADRKRELDELLGTPPIEGLEDL